MTYVSSWCHGWPSLTASWLFGFTHWPPAHTEHEAITSCRALQWPGLLKGPLTWQHGRLWQGLFYSFSLYSLNVSPALRIKGIYLSSHPRGQEKWGNFPFLLWYVRHEKVAKSKGSCYLGRVQPLPALSDLLVIAELKSQSHQETEKGDIFTME